VTSPPFSVPAPSTGQPPAATSGLTWITAGLISLALVGAAVVSRNGTVVAIAALTIVVTTVFALRPVIGVALFLLVRPSLDLWADKTAAHVGTHGVNAAAITGVLLIALAGSYIAEHWKLAKQARCFRPFVLFALIAGLSIGVAPSKSFGSTEWLRLATLVVVYGAAYVAVRVEKKAAGWMAAVVLASGIVPVVVGVVQTARGTGRLIASYGRATGTFLHRIPTDSSSRSSSASPRRTPSPRRSAVDSWPGSPCPSSSWRSSGRTRAPPGSASSSACS
jgi:hypothetical protein